MKSFPLDLKVNNRQIMFVDEETGMLFFYNPSLIQKLPAQYQSVLVGKF